VHLCKVSLTEPQGISYYWGRDLDGEPDTLWGLEGYTEPDGFNFGHPSSDVFKVQMLRVDSENLLGDDYDLHHYNLVGGWLKRPHDPQADSKTSHVAVLHFFSRKGTRDQVIEQLEALGKEALEKEPRVSSFGILKELNDESLVTVWLRCGIVLPSHFHVLKTPLEHPPLRILRHTLRRKLTEDLLGV
jgi:hypothetical protein